MKLERTSVEWSELPWTKADLWEFVLPSGHAEEDQDP